MSTPDEILARLRERRAVVFGVGAIDRAASILGEEGWEGFDLLTTERALARADDALGPEASRTLIVPAGPVPEAAAAILTEVSADRLVALGGGRVVDAAKAIASTRAECEVAAVPTTLAGSTMTHFHRFPEGHTPMRSVRPSLVVADPDAMCSAPPDFLQATAANALAHATDSLFGPLADASSRADALQAVELICQGLTDSDRESLALGALLAGDAIDRAGFGVQHALAQSTVAASGSSDHARIHAAILPYAISAQGQRRPEAAAGLEDALGGGLEERLREVAGSRPLAEIGVDQRAGALAVAMAASRPEASAPPEGGPWGEQDLVRVLASAGV